MLLQSNIADFGVLVNKFYFYSSAKALYFFFYAHHFTLFKVCE